MMSFTDKAASGSPQERADWAERLIPRSTAGPATFASTEEQAWALANHSHGASDADMFNFLATR
eukprot:11501248-Karenia_brevis.AAC.1